MAITYTMTWAGGLDSNVNIGFTLTDDQGKATPWIVPAQSITNCPDHAARAVADELHNQSGSATGTVTVAIA